MNHSSVVRYAAIIAGGSARRAGGECKPLWEVEGETILARTVGCLRPLVDGILLSLSRQSPALLREAARFHRLDVVLDDETDLGPMSGIARSLAVAHERGASTVLAVAGDMPRLAPSVLRFIIEHPAGIDAVIPQVDGVSQPLLARYHTKLADYFAERVKARSLRLRDVPQDLRMRGFCVVEPDREALLPFDKELSSFHNCNTASELLRE